jgi:hypothetical protein
MGGSSRHTEQIKAVQNGRTGKNIIGKERQKDQMRNPGVNLGKLKVYLLSGWQRHGDGHTSGKVSKPNAEVVDAEEEDPGKEAHSKPRVLACRVLHNDELGRGENLHATEEVTNDRRCHEVGREQAHKRSWNQSTLLQLIAGPVRTRDKANIGNPRRGGILERMEKCSRMPQGPRVEGKLVRSSRARSNCGWTGKHLGGNACCTMRSEEALCRVAGITSNQDG